MPYSARVASVAAKSLSVRQSKGTAAIGHSASSGQWKVWVNAA
jgi:hypothetical protein